MTGLKKVRYPFPIFLTDPTSESYGKFKTFAAIYLLSFLNPNAQILPYWATKLSTCISY